MSKGSTAVIDFRKRLKLALVSCFNDHCALCGEKFPEYCYDFHHKDPSQKDFSIGGRGITYSKEKSFREVQKCVMLCSNCHRKVHNENINFFPFEVRPNEEKFYSTIENLKQDREISRKNRSTMGKKILPDREELKKLIREYSFKDISILYDVTDNAVRKKCRNNGLPTNKQEINKYSDKEWEKL